MQTSLFTIKSIARIAESIPFEKFNEKENVFVQIFCGTGAEMLQAVASEISKQLPQATSIGATTDGEIFNRTISTHHCVVSISTFKSTSIHSLACTGQSSKKTGEHLAKNLVTEKTKLLIILSDGTTTNGDELLKGIYKHKPNIMIAGGMAGDNATFTQTYVSHNDTLIKSGAVAIALDSDQLQVRNHYSFDWQPVGKKMLITHAERNRVYTINNKPAADVYARYLGDDIAKHMPATGIEFPLVMERKGVQVARAILATHPDGSLSFAGNIPTNSEVQFGFGNTASIINNSISRFSALANKNIETFYIYSCMARRRYMPDNIKIEITPFSNTAPTAGFFTYGEFFHTPHSNELMNQTLTAVALSESDESIFNIEEKHLSTTNEYKGIVQTFDALSHLIKATTDELNETFSLFDSGQFILFKWRNEDNFPVDYVSNNVKNIIGYSKKIFQRGDVSFTSLIHSDDYSRVISETETAINTPGCKDFIHQPYRIKKKDGEYIWLYDTTQLIRDENDDVVHIIGYLTDISARKEDEETLHLYASIFHSSSEAIVVTDSKNHITSVNPAFQTITGYSEKEVIGKKPSILASGKHDKVFYQEMWDKITKNGAWQGEVWNRKKNGQLYAEWLSISTIYNNDGSTKNYIALFSDITEVKVINEQVEFLAHHDALTSLPNRILFQDRIQQSIIQASRHDKKVALLYLDIDHFKSVNDSLGHRIGDLLLKEIVLRLQKSLHRNDTISRQGGDEFLILISDMDNHDPIMHVIDKIYLAMKLPFNIDGHLLHTSSSIGIAVYPDDGNDFGTLLQHADTAMYHAKQAGRNTHHFFTAEMHNQAKQKHFLQNSLHDAIPNQEFHLQYQPQYCLISQKITGVEALLRWDSAELGSVSPENFIPLAEESGQIINIGNWVIHEACKQLQLLRQEGFNELIMAINISALQFKQANFTCNLVTIVEFFDIPTQYIELELTESILISNIQRNIDTLHQLKALGFKLSIDDFGTGYSSLSYLKRFPADVIKIDRSFISDIANSEDDASIVNAIIGLCKNFNLRVIAEGVETNEQLEYLKKQGCDSIQGYLYSRPLDPVDLINKLINDKESN